MITAFLLLPVGAILVWLYWYLLPQVTDVEGRSRRIWGWADLTWLLVLLVCARFFHQYAVTADYGHFGPLYPQLVSVVGAYGILAIGLAMGLAWRKRGAIFG